MSFENLPLGPLYVKRPKHTPGTWEAVELRTQWAVRAPGSKPGTHAIVATIHETAVRATDSDRAEHDAKLIALTPRLLAQLVEMTDLAERYGVGEHCDGNLIAAREVIAQAKGGAS